MANKDAPTGFTPIDGSAPCHEYTVTASQTIFKGDPVIITNAGTVSIGAASATTTHLGISAEYIASATAGDKILVYDGVETEFVVQSTTGQTPAQTNVFNTADIVTYAAGNTSTGLSIMELDTMGTSSKPWLVLRLHPTPDNAWGEHAKVVVKYNQSVRIAAYAGL